MISLIGIALAFFYFWNAFYNHIAVPGWATIVILQSLFSGITFLMLGIISEYIWRIFSELDKKPEFIMSMIETTFLLVPIGSNYFLCIIPLCTISPCRVVNCLLHL